MKMESDIKVQCNEHGESNAAYVCRHLLDGLGIGFNVGIDPDHPDATCPDAWCDDCELRLNDAGEWTEELLKQADIQLVCVHCYSIIRAKNWNQNDAAFEKLLEESIEYLDGKQATITQEFRIDQHERWDWNQDTAQLVFSNDGKPALICDVVFVGSISTRSETWLWSWANDSNVEGVKKRMREVRAYGEEHRFNKLAGAYWPAQPVDGWQMTSIAARLLNAIGAYRTPSDSGFTYMVITRAGWAQ